MWLCEWFLMLLFPFLPNINCFANEFWKERIAKKTEKREPFEIDDDIDKDDDDDRRQIGIHYDSSIMEFFELSQQKMFYCWTNIYISASSRCGITPLLHCCVYVCVRIRSWIIILFSTIKKRRRIYAICAAKRLKRLTIQQ